MDDLHLNFFFFVCIDCSHSPSHPLCPSSKPSNGVATISSYDVSLSTDVPSPPSSAMHEIAPPHQIRRKPIGYIAPSLVVPVRRELRQRSERLRFKPLRSPPGRSVVTTTRISALALRSPSCRRHQPATTRSSPSTTEPASLCRHYCTAHEPSRTFAHHRLPSCTWSRSDTLRPLLLFVSQRLKRQR